MSFATECVAVTAVAATLAFLAWAAWSDLAVRLIPNAACVGVAVAGLVVRGLSGMEAVLWSAAMAVAAFCVLVVLHARGIMGGGDVKLIAAMALNFSPAGTLRFAVVTAMIGGGVAVLHLVLRRNAVGLAGFFRHFRVSGRARGGVWAWRRVAVVEIWRIGRHGSLPYGVAIALGGAKHVRFRASVGGKTGNRP